MLKLKRLLYAAFSSLLISFPAAAHAVVHEAMLGTAQGLAASHVALPDARATAAPTDISAPLALDATLSEARPAADVLGKDLTQDFLEMHTAVKDLSARAVPVRIPLPAEALGAHFILVKGLLANHTPDYFDGNRRRLESLGLQVTVLKIDTEGRTAAGLRAIQDAVRSSNRPVVLIGHSRGGMMVHDWYRNASPEDKAKVSRLALLQAPVAGTPYADWSMSDVWQHAKILVGGWFVYHAPNLPRAVRELSLRARAPALASMPAWAPGDLDKVYAVRTFIQNPSEHKFYTADHARIESLPGGGRNDGMVPLSSAHIEGASNIVLPDLDHRNLVVEWPDAKSIQKGYHPSKKFNVENVTEALVRLMFPYQR